MKEDSRNNSSISTIAKSRIFREWIFYKEIDLKYYSKEITPVFPIWPVLSPGTTGIKLIIFRGTILKSTLLNQMWRI